MPNEQIYQQTAAGSAALTDQLAADNAANVTVKLTLAQIRDLMQNSIAELSALDQIKWDTTYTPGAMAEGEVFWDADEATLAVVPSSSGVVLQVGREMHVKCYNNTGGTITNGTLVYATGSVTGGVPEVAKAQAHSSLTTHVLGMATEDISDASYGYATTIGLVHNVDTSGYTAGDKIWLSPTVAGGFQNSQPNSPYYSYEVGQILTVSATDGVVLVIPSIAEQLVKTLTFTLPLRGVLDTALNLTGEFRSIATGQTGDFATVSPISNNHVALFIHSITGTGTVTVTGTSLSETTSIPQVGDTEVITLDGSVNQYYQSSKKWWEISSITFSAGITAINYDLYALGYTDLQNLNFTLLGYRLDMFSQGTGADLRFKIQKVQDDGAGKMSIVDVEDIGVNAAATVQIIDYLRSGVDDRSYTPSTSIWLNNSTLVFKQNDFVDYFSNNENVFEGSTKDEGFILRFEGVSGGLTNVDFATLQLRYKLS